MSGLLRSIFLKKKPRFQVACRHMQVELTLGRLVVNVQ